ncbi:MAG: ribosome recycling factor [Prevotellaceae bacterium]|jgi:ribosome recycling factor|nr:ribosome recycling factor [Prevotellaceae bacterium]
MDTTKAKEIVNLADNKIQKAIEHLETTLLGIRAGKANPALFNQVMVDYYGSQTPLPQVSSITSPDARSILIQPWGKNMIHPIEKAIMQANLGFTPQNNGESIRINIPPLTEERRKDLVKQSKHEGENARVSIRNARRDAIEAIKKLQKEGLSEDLAKDFEAEMQKTVDNYNKVVDTILEKKEKEILAV